jgi:tetratricopeptide (TPR) repeat protein
MNPIHIIIIAAIGSSIVFLSYLVIKSFVTPRRIDGIQKLLKQRKYNSAIKLAKSIASKDPSDYTARYWLGEAYYNEGDYMEACNAYGKASHYGYNMLLAISRQSLCHTKLSNIPAAIERAETAYLLNPSDFVLRKELSSLLYSTGISMYKTENYDMAKECFNRVIWLTPTMLEPYLQMGHIHLKQGDTNAAESVLNQALKLKPDFPPARKLLDSLK